LNLAEPTQAQQNPRMSSKAMLYDSVVWFFVAPVGWAFYDLFAVYDRNRMPFGSIKP
jgi:hypothetical protein